MPSAAEPLAPTNGRMSLLKAAWSASTDRASPGPVTTHTLRPRNEVSRWTGSRVAELSEPGGDVDPVALQRPGQSPRDVVQPREVDRPPARQGEKAATGPTGQEGSDAGHACSCCGTGPAEWTRRNRGSRPGVGAQSRDPDQTEGHHPGREQLHGQGQRALHRRLPEDEPAEDHRDEHAHDVEHRHGGGQASRLEGALVGDDGREAGQGQDPRTPGEERRGGTDEIEVVRDVLDQAGHQAEEDPRRRAEQGGAEVHEPVAGREDVEEHEEHECHDAGPGASPRVGARRFPRRAWWRPGRRRGPATVTVAARRSARWGRRRLTAARTGMASTTPQSINGCTRASVPRWSAIAWRAKEASPRAEASSHSGVHARRASRRTAPADRSMPLAAWCWRDVDTAKPLADARAITGAVPTSSVKHPWPARGRKCGCMGRSRDPDAPLDVLVVCDAWLPSSRTSTS